MTLLTSRPSGWPRHCCCSHAACWTGCWPSPTCWPSLLACASSPAVRLGAHRAGHPVGSRLSTRHPAGIPFTYRGLPCPYASSLLASTFLLTGGHVTLLRVTAIAMVLFMVDRGFYPHDKVLESQCWKKAIYAGGKERR